MVKDLCQPIPKRSRNDTTGNSLSRFALARFFLLHKLRIVENSNERIKSFSQLTFQSSKDDAKLNQVPVSKKSLLL